MKLWNSSKPSLEASVLYEKLNVACWPMSFNNLLVPTCSELHCINNISKLSLIVYSYTWNVKYHLKLGYEDIYFILISFLFFSCDYVCFSIKSSRGFASSWGFGYDGKRRICLFQCWIVYQVGEKYEMKLHKVNEILTSTT